MHGLCAAFAQVDDGKPQVPERHIVPLIDIIPVWSTVLDNIRHFLMEERCSSLVAMMPAIPHIYFNILKMIHRQVP